MATQLFLGNAGQAHPGVHRGTNNTKLNGVAAGWAYYLAKTTRNSDGTVSNTVPSVTGPTNGIEVQQGSIPSEWLTSPLAANATISGTITVNLWAAEATMNDNLAVNCIIERLDSQLNIISTIANTARVTEVALTTSAVNNFTVTPTSTNMLKGERLRIRVYFDDAGTMATGGTGTFYFNSATAAVSGDSYVTLTETLTFQTTAPSGTQLFLTDTSTPAVGIAVCDSYSEVNQDSIYASDTAGYIAGQTFMGNGRPLRRAAFYLRSSGAPTGNVRAVLYATSGTYGSGTQVGTGAVLATSSPVSRSGISSSFQLVYFDFDGTFTLTNSTSYVIGVTSDTTDTSNFLYIGLDQSTPTHTGNWAIWSGGWSTFGADFCFYVYTETLHKEMWTSRGAAAVTVQTLVPGGWINPIQWTSVTTGGGGGALEWYSKLLNAFTLDGLVRLNLRAFVNVSSSTGMRAEIAVCDSDGTNVTVYSVAGIYSTQAPSGAPDAVGDNIPTAQAAFVGWLCGAPISVVTGQRIRLRVYADDTGGFATGGCNASFVYAGPTAATGDSWIQLPQAVTEFIPPPPATQAAYRFYADGTEAGSTALAAQSTGITIGDADTSMLLRLRMQSTDAQTHPSTTDWQLQFRKNGGAWAYVSTDTSTYSYAMSNIDMYNASMSDFQPLQAQGFNGNNQNLVRVGFALYKLNNPVGTMTARLYASAGAGPTTLLEESAPINVSVLGSTAPGALTYFTFSGDTLCVSGNAYYIAFQYSATSSAVGGVYVGCDSSSPTGTGTLYWGDNPTTPTWTLKTYDLAWDLTLRTPSDVVTFDSPNLTHLAATTNRLTGGTGTFQAGKVGENFSITDVGMTGNNYTEFLYAIQIKGARVAVGDLVELRVVRDFTASGVGLTYTSIPAITIAAAALNVTGFMFFQDDADPNTSTQIGFVNNSRPVSDATVRYVLRMQISNTDAALSDSGALTLEISKNSGAWFRPTVTVTNGIQCTSSAFITTTAALTSSRVTGGIGTYVNGQAVENADQATAPIAPGQYTELAFVIVTDYVNLSYGDVFQFRLTRAGVTTGITYTQTPVMSVISTRLYFGNVTAGVPGIHRGTNSANLRGTAVGWSVMALNAASGSAQTTLTATTVVGPTNGIEVASGGFPVEWISPPLAQAVTVAGPVFANLWASESALTVNAQVQFILERMDSQGNIVSTIAQSAQGGELTAALAVYAFNLTPTSTNMLEGDRFRCRVFFKDGGGTMAAGTGTFSFGAGSTQGVSGDSYISFTEIFNYLTDEPTGTILYPTDVAGPAVGAANEKEMWTSRGSVAITAQSNTPSGWTVPVQMTDTPGGAPIEWYSKQLSAFTLDGLVRFNVRVGKSGAPNGAACRAELAVCNGDGSGAVVWGANCLVDSATPGGALGAGTDAAGTMVAMPIRAWLAGTPTAVTNGQRLRFRMYLDDASSVTISGGATGNLQYSGPTAAASGDTWIQLPQSITEMSVGPDLTMTNAGWYEDDAAPATSTLILGGGGQIAEQDANKNLQLRFQLSNTDASSRIEANAFTLQYQINWSGTWIDLPASGGVKQGTSAFIAGTAAVSTNRLSGGTGSFSAGQAIENAALTSGPTVAAGSYTENVWVIAIDSAVAVGGDVYQFRVARSGSPSGVAYWVASPELRVIANWPATITTNWGNWTPSAAAVRETAATSTGPWGNWTTSAAGVRATAATSTGPWGNWTATGAATPSHVATITDNWGVWTATSTGLVPIRSGWSNVATATTFAPANITATVTDNWGNWITSATGSSSHPGTVTTNWGNWTATAAVTPEHPATVTTNWGNWTTSAVGVRSTAATITVNWGNWTASATAIADRPATITTNWGNWVTSAAAIPLVNVFVTDNWGNWTTSAAASVSRPATITTNWGNWTTSATAQPIERVGTISTNFGNWTATAAAVVSRVATITQNWGNWTATAVTTPDHPATTITAWGNWTSSAAATVNRPASITQTYNTWTASATAVRETAGALATNFGNWTATAAGIRSVPATVTTTWTTWTAIGNAPVQEHPGAITTNWGVWTGVANGSTASGYTEWFATITTNWSPSTFSPSDIAGLVIWLEADALPNGSLASWPNPGSGADAPMVGTPVPVVTPGVTPSGQKAVRFSAGEGRVRMTGIGIDAVGTLVYVARMVGPTAGRIVTSNYPPNNLLIGFWNSFEDVAYDSGFFFPDMRTAVTTNWKMYSSDTFALGGEERMFSNGVYLSSGSSNGWGGYLNISGYDNTTAETCDFEFAGLLFYDSKLTDTLRQQAEGYMRQKYLTPGGLPSALWATSTATVNRPATITSNWGNWNALALAIPEASGVILTNWGVWIASANGVVQRAATITTTFTTWTASATTTPEHPASITTNFGNWITSANGVRATGASITQSWGNWTATATTQPDHPATTTTSWGNWTTSANAQPIQRNASVLDNWGNWITSAAGIRSTAATIVTPWGNWTAVANGNVIAEEIFATITTNFGNWTTSATAQVIERVGTITTNFGVWNANATATRSIVASFTQNWGNWTASATAQVIERNATILTNFGNWTASAVATVNRPATIIDNWGNWQASAAAIPFVSGFIGDTWGPWVASGTPNLGFFGTASATWPTWTAIANGDLAGQKSGNIATNWGTWTASAAASRTTFPTITTTWNTWTATGNAPVQGHPASITTVWNAAFAPETQAYLTATGLDQSFAPALDVLVVGLKNKGLWSKMAVVYPLIGGTADLHKWNLIDPRDADDAYRLTYYGGVSTHTPALGYRANPLGATVNGPGYADTHFVPVNVLASQDSTHLAFYSTEDTPPADRAEMGCYNWTPTGRFHVIVRYLTVNAFYYGQSEAGASNVAVPAASGLFVATRTASNDQAGYRNGVMLSQSANGSIAMPPVSVVLGGISGFANHSDVPCGFASIGAGLTVQDNADLYQVVQAYQTALGRQVGTPIVIGGSGESTGGWTATATGTVNRSATILDNWGSWNAAAAAIPYVSAFVGDTWGPWVATASAIANRAASITDNWGVWTATAQGAPDRSASATGPWGNWTASATATVADTATATGSWGTWTATASAPVLEHPGAINTSWGNWTASAAAVHAVPATITTANWGTWTATAVGDLLGNIGGMVATNWGTWNASANGTHSLAAAISTTWVTWNASAAASLNRAATITTNWDAWAGVAFASALAHSGSILTTWTTWNASANATVGHTVSGSISTTFGPWTASAAGIVSRGQPGTHYLVNVTGMVRTGTVIATLPEGVAVSITTGMHSEPSTSTDNVVTYNFRTPVNVAGSISTTWGALMPGTVTFSDAAPHEVRVPPTITTATLECWGQGPGPGAVSPYHLQGHGAYIAALVNNLVPGESLWCFPGGRGQYAGPGGFNGGGNCTGLGGSDGNGGNGASDIRRGGVLFSHRILVGGAGGGGINASGAGPGGDGGYPNGTAGTAFSGNGTGGTQTVGGNSAFGNVPPAPDAGSFGIGGTSPTGPGGGRGGGGGGGGWYGGGAGASGFGVTCAGGGGSSYVSPTLTLITAEMIGSWLGNGQVTITFTPNANFGSWVCQGSATIFTPPPSQIVGQYIFPQGSSGADPFLSGPMVSGRTLYTISQSGTPEVWAFNLDAPGVNGAAASATRTTITGTGSTVVYAGHSISGVATGGYLWQLGSGPYRIMKIDATTGVIVGSVDVPYSGQCLGTTNWVYNMDSTGVRRIDPAGPSIAATYLPGSTGVGWMFPDPINNALWMACQGTKLLVRLDPITLAVVGTPVAIPSPDAYIMGAVDQTGTYVYIHNNHNGDIYRVTIATGALTTFPGVINVFSQAETGPCAVVGNQLYVWHKYVTAGEALLARVNTDTMTATYLTGYLDPYFGAHEGFHYDGHNLWLIGRNVMSGNQSDSLIKLG